MWMKTVWVHFMYLTNLLVPCYAGSLGTLIYILTWKSRDPYRRGTSIYVVTVEASRREQTVHARLCSCRRNLKNLCVCM